jgi:flagellar FliL protein
MATSAAAAAKPPAEAAPTAAAKKNGKSRLIIILVVALLALGGAGAWFFMTQGAGDGKEDSWVSTEPPVFLPLAQFTVNLQSEDEQRFLQVSMTLKLAEQAVVDAIAAQLPEVRSRVLLLLSSRKASELISLEGKTKLATDIAREIEIPITPAKAAKKRSVKATGKTDKTKAHRAQQRVLAVYFTHFIVQ